MKKIVSLLALLSLVLLTFSGAGAQGETEGTLNTSILVQNLSTEAATLSVNFYNVGGTKTGTKTPVDGDGNTVPLGGELSTTFDQRFESGDPGEDPFQGAAIVTADKPIGAVVQEVRTGGSGGVNSYEAYNGVASVGKEFQLPLIMRAVPSAGKTWNTFIAIQNTNTEAAANVTVDFTPDPAVGLGTADSQSYVIPKGGTQYIMQREQEAGLGEIFYGSAKVTSTDQDVAVVVNGGPTDGSGLAAYPTYVAGSTSLYVPGAMKNILSLGNNYFTSLTIVNMSGTPTTVEIDYTPSDPAATDPAPYTKVVTTSGTVDLRYDTAIADDTFYGSMSISAQGGGEIAAMLNTRGDNPDTGAAVYATTYSAFASGVDTAYFPYLLRYIGSAGYNWSTSILVQNLDPAAGDLTLDIAYNAADGTTKTSSQAVSTFSTVDLRYDEGLGAAGDPEVTFYGGAKLTAASGSASQSFNAVVLVRGSDNTGDALSSYLGISQ